MRHIDEYDYEVSQKKERYKFGFSINFKKMYVMNHTLMEDNSERDENYPKNILLNMYFGCWVAMTILFCFSKNLLWIATLPLIIFYIIALVGVFKTWKEYNYKMAPFVFMNIGAFIFAAGVGVAFQTFVLRI